MRLIDHLIARGDLNGDGVEDAVVLLEDDTSGTGRFVYAAAVLDALGNPTPTEAVMIGDRIQVKSLAIDGSEVVADVVAQGPSDAACCASWNVRKVFALENGRLTERSSEELSQISLADLDGTKWRLVDLNGDREPVLPDTQITMLFADGQISGSAGCNNYNSTVSSEADSPSSFVVGAIATTKKLCSEPVMNQEQAYLARLGRSGGMVVRRRPPGAHLRIARGRVREPGVRSGRQPVRGRAFRPGRGCRGAGLGRERKAA